MHRRDFLLLRHAMSPRTAELSCERLHMSYLDWQSGSEPQAPDEVSSFVEPQAVIPPRDLDAEMQDLESQLEDVEVIRVSGTEWLRPDDLRARVEALLGRLEARGIRVEKGEK